jgi:hypothetical protein
MMRSRMLISLDPQEPARVRASHGTAEAALEFLQDAEASRERILLPSERLARDQRVELPPIAKATGVVPGATSGNQVARNTGLPLIRYCPGIVGDANMIGRPLASDIVKVWAKEF